MFRITEDPSSGNLVQCLAKNYKNDSIVSVDMEKVGDMAPYFDPLCMGLGGEPDGKRPLGRPRRGWVDNIRTDLQEVGCGYVDWIRLAQDRNRWRTLVSAVMNLGVP